MIFATCLVGCACLAQDHGSKPPPSTTPHAIEIAVAPAADLWFELRTRAAAAEGPAEGDPFAPATAAARRLERTFSEPRVWQRVDEYFLTSELHGGFAPTSREPLRLPSQFRKPEARIKEVAEASLELGLALDAIAPDWLEREWPARRAELEKRRAEILAVLTPTVQWMLMDEIGNELRIPPPPAPLGIVLVTRMPPGGDETLPVGQQQLTGFVHASGRDRSDLLEAILHEGLHVCQSRAFWPPSVMTALSNKFMGAGVRGETVRDAEHSLYFLYAAELVRRHADPEHVDSGVSSGEYELMGGVVEAVRPLLADYLAGKVEASAFSNAVVAAIAAL